MKTESAKRMQQVTQKLKKLCLITHDLKNGEDYPITRLTVVKSLCPDQKTAARFCAYLAGLAYKRKEFAARSVRFTPTEKTRLKKLAAEALREIDLFLQRHSESRMVKLYDLLGDIREVNNVYKNIPYGVLREVQDWRILLVEKALQCALTDDVSTAGFWAYQIARDYAEKYDPRYGTGLIPASAPLLSDVVDFWCRHYFGQSAAVWCSSQHSKKPSR